MLDELNEAAEQLGGRWVKINSKADGVLEGNIIAFEKREKFFEGKPVYRRGSIIPRYEWVFTLKVDGRDDEDDDGVRKFSANESCQRAIAAAIRESGQKAEEGGRLKIGVTEDPPSDRAQAVYRAKYTPPEPKPATLDADEVFPEGEEPF